MAQAKQKVKLATSDDYKNAVKRREADMFRQKANEIANKAKNEQNAVLKRREGILQKHQKRIDDKKAEIILYYDKMEKAQKKVDDGIYNTIGIGSLIMFFITCIVSLVFYKTGHEYSAYGASILSFGLIIFSIFMQAAEFDAENQVREYKEKIAIARKQLEKLDKPLLK